MSIDKVHLTELSFVGTAIRTSNANKGGDIGNHWHEALKNPIMESIVNKKNEMPYGIYTKYESDYNGMYDHIVAYSGESSDPNIVRLDVPESDYLVFDTTGPQPETVINTWEKIWSYFEDSKETRSYVADFEEYDSKMNAKIFIGIK